jgi:ACS family tartrate transporter-like MFS transporter
VLLAIGSRFGDADRMQKIGDDAVLERRVLQRITRRIIPVLFLGVLIGYLDRVNVAFAALTMNQSLGLSPSAYGWGASVFFLGYLLAEIPGTLCVARFGSRLCMTIFMGAWGCLSVLMSQVTTLEGFLTVRFLIGVAEAGFFPGTILYMSYWVPAAARAKFGAYFMLAIPLSIVIGGPISGLILQHLDTLAGLQSWQWLFIVEGLPAVLLAVVVFLFISDRPQSAAWLPAPERDWLIDTLHAESESRSRRGAFQWRDVINARVLLLCAVQSGGPAVAYGVTMWLPQVVKGFGMSVVQTGFICAVPFATSAAAMWWWSWHSDKTGERQWHLTSAPLLAATGLLASLAVPSPLAKLACLIVASLGIFSFLPLAWAASHQLFTPRSAPIGYGMISMSGAVAGFVSPYAMGVLKERSGGFETGVVFLAIIGLLAAFCAYRLMRPAARTDVGSAELRA